MNVYELTTRVEEEQHIITIELNLKAVYKLTYINANFDYSFKDLAVKHLTKFATEQYPNDTFYTSKENPILIKSNNRDCMSKIEKILINIRPQINEAYNTETKSEDAAGSGNLLETLNSHFTYGILDAQLAENHPITIKRAKI